jgi:hypothetical protein
MNKKVIEKRCSNCTFNYIQNRTYRDMCNKNKYALVIPDMEKGITQKSTTCRLD